jgi:hypothetical protein
MASPASVPYDTYKEETEKAIETCYPINEGTTLVSSKTVLFEINENSDKYPLFAKVMVEKKKKLIITRICLYTFKWELWAGSRGASSNSAVYRRDVPNGCNQ